MSTKEIFVVHYEDGTHTWYGARRDAEKAASEGFGSVERFVPETSLRADQPAATETGPRCPGCYSDDPKQRLLISNEHYGPSVCDHNFHSAEQAPQGALNVTPCCSGIGCHVCRPMATYREPQGAPDCSVCGDEDCSPERHHPLKR